MLVAFRVDASPAIGLGHVKRCLSLAHALAATGARVVFVARDLGVDVRGMVATAGFEILVLPRPTGSMPSSQVPHGHWAEVDAALDVRQTVAALADRRCDWLVVDHYAFDADWHRQVADATGARLAVIDDVADRPLHADVLIDHNHCDDHRRKYGSRLATGTPILGGPRFALLGPAYGTAPRYVLHAEVRSIGIFMGGADAGGLSAVAWRACREVAGFDGPIEIVTTRESPRLGELQRTVADDAHTTLRLDLPSLHEFFSRHDLQIGAGGGATWERCCIGAPSIVVIAADNQAVVADALQSLEIAEVIPQTVTAFDIGHALCKLIPDAGTRRAMASRSRQLVDGRGALRAALWLLADELVLRPAEVADAEITYQWRNHESTRAASLDSRPIAWSDHREWWRNSLANPTRHVWISSVGQVDVGVIRFDDDQDVSVVSLYLDPSLLGLRLGSAMLRAGELARSRLAPPPARLAATVRRNNAQSRRLFESAGYQFVDDEHCSKAVVAAHTRPGAWK